MILDMNIKLEGIDEDFLDELDELIEDLRVEYFIINPLSKDELVKTQELCNDNQRFKYTLPLEFKDLQDDNCVAMRILDVSDIEKVEDFAVVISSELLDENSKKILNEKELKGIVLDSKPEDTSLNNFAFTISKESLKKWPQKTIMDLDYNLITLQSDYPEQSYDDFIDVMLKDISDLTFRAEQTIAAGGTRRALKTFKML